MNIILIRQKELLDNTVTFTKTDERFQHIKKILKLSTGSVFKAGIINGEKGRAEVIRFTDDYLTARFTALSAAAELPHIRLVLGFPRPIQLRRILRDAAGLGIEALYLSGTELGEKSYLHADLAAIEEIERLLTDGCCQAGETRIPRVYRSYSLRHFFEQYEHEMQSDHIRAVLDVPSAAAVPAIKPLTALQWDGCKPLWLAAGNERGWSADERLLFAGRGFQAYSMGSRILRTETAVAASLAVCLAAGGIWSAGCL